MHKAILALALLAAGCATDLEGDVDTVMVQRHRRTTQTVVQKPQETRSARLVGEPANPPQRVAPAIAQPAPRVQIILPQQPQPNVDFLQVGPPVVLDSPVPSPSAPTYQPPPAPLPPPRVAGPAPIDTPYLETAEGMGYQNGGVNGTTGPLTAPAPALPTAEGLQYRP